MTVWHLRYACAKRAETGTSYGQESTNGSTGRAHGETSIGARGA